MVMSASFAAAAGRPSRSAGSNLARKRRFCRPSLAAERALGLQSLTTAPLTAPAFYSFGLEGL